MTSSLSPRGHLAVRWVQGATSLGRFVVAADRLVIQALAVAGAGCIAVAFLAG